MTDHLISVKDFAEKNGLLKQTVFKVLKRLEIEPSKSRGGNQHRGQTISYITEEDGRRVWHPLLQPEALKTGKKAMRTNLLLRLLYTTLVFFIC